MNPDLSAVARLIADPARSAILLHLLDGCERSASDLALRAGATPQSASNHLAKLVDGGLIVARSEGRHRFFRLRTPEIAHAIEVLGSIAPVAPVSSLRAHTLMERLRVARTCYDHAAGKLGVAIGESLERRRILARRDGIYDVTKRGSHFFAALGIDCDALRLRKRTFARPCLDWTERRDHLAGALGAAILHVMLDRRWVTNNPRDRALTITPHGTTAIEKTLGVPLSS
ncbi:MAG TPA: metalloregulator ArsR/SmtB family transcription factor [Candidatus Aquilonibacter sp.]|nr:metalloregulator ArsR/SmtB family transcription factor [Candidatus Aquilonibacter sp.]